MLFPDTINYQRKCHLWVASLEAVGRWGPKNAKELQTIDIAFDYSPKCDNKTLLHFSYNKWRNQAGNPSGIFIPIGYFSWCCKVLCMLSEEKTNIQSYTSMIPVSYNDFSSERHFHWCNSNKSAIGLTNNNLIGFKAH